MNQIVFIPLEGLGSIHKNDNLALLLVKAAERQGTPFCKGDILVVAHKIVSKAEGRTVNLDAVAPTAEAIRLAELTGKRPALVQVILEESDRVIPSLRGVLICYHKLGWICANAGVDLSNAPSPNTAVLLPADPDLSAKRIAQNIKTITDKEVAVLISDTHGRPLRNGIVGVAIGSYGISPIKSYIGLHDRAGRMLLASKEAVADELAAGASLLMGQGDEGIPAVIVRGYIFDYKACGSENLKRKGEMEIFRPQTYC